MYSVTKSDVKEIAAHIELLAKQLQDKLSSDLDFWYPANELVRDFSTMIFALGEYHASKQLGATNSLQKNKKTAAKTTTRMSRIYYRDSQGRFASKTTGTAYPPKP